MRMSSAVIVYEFAKVDNVLLASDEGGGHKIHVVFDSEKQIAFVLLA